MRTLVAFAGLLVWTRISRAEVQLGGIAAARMTNLAGEVASDATASGAVAGIIQRPFTSRWSGVLEPGVRQAGSGKYSLYYLSVPVLAVMRQPMGGLHIRAIAGLVPSVNMRAALVSPADSEHDNENIRDHVRWWDLGITAGVGIEYTGDDTTAYFVELRVSRGLATIHADTPGLFIVNEEIGLWAGLLR